MKKINIIIAIILGAIMITSGMVYLGSQMSKSGSITSEEFDKLIDGYAERQQKNQKEQQLLAEKEKEGMAKLVKKISEKDWVKGNPDAEITIYEYSDYECPYCKRFYETPGKVVAKYGEKVNTVFRHFPLSFHDPLATQQAVASECAGEQGGKEGFFNYHKEIFERTSSNRRESNSSMLYKIAMDLKLDSVKFKKCLDENKYYNKVKEDIKSGIEAGITGTPGVIVKNNKNGKVIVLPGAVPIEMLEEAVEKLLK